MQISHARGVERASSGLRSPRSPRSQSRFRRHRRPSHRRTSLSSCLASTTSMATSTPPPAAAVSSRRLPAVARPRGRGRLPRQPAANAAPAEPQHPDRFGRRPDRRQPAAVGAVPRRADDRGHERDRPRPQRGGQPRVRRGRHRAPAHAERRLRPRRRLPQRDASAAPTSSSWRRTSCLQGPGETALPALRDRERSATSRSASSDDPRGDPRHRLRVRHPGLDFLDEARPQQVRGRAPQRARRARDRRAAARGRLADAVCRHRLLQRGTGAIIDIVDRTSDAVDLFVSGHTHQPYVCTAGNNSLIDGRRSRARLVRPAGHRHRVHGRPRDEGRQGRRGRSTTGSSPARGPRPQTSPQLIAGYNTLAAPIANQRVGRISADITREHDPARTVRPEPARLPDRRRAARRHVEPGPGDAVLALHEPRRGAGRPGVRRFARR